MSEDIQFDFAKLEDIPVILSLIKGLAEYENMLNEVVATEELLKEWIFEKEKAEVILEKVQGEIVGFALFFHNFSTFLGKSGIYIEDLFVYPEYRGMGYGKLLFKEIGKIALDRDCGRLEWWCLNWNKPSIDFYKSMGAKTMDDWTVYRISGEELNNLSK